MKNIILGIVGAIAIIAVIYGSWRLERQIHYKWSYQSMVQSEIQKQVVPLQVKIDNLEARVKKLESK